MAERELEKVVIIGSAWHQHPFPGYLDSPTEYRMRFRRIHWSRG